MLVKIFHKLFISSNCFHVARENYLPVPSPITSPHQEPAVLKDSSHNDQVSTICAATESASGCKLPLPDLAPHAFCLMVLQRSPQMPANHHLVVEQLVNHHPETFTVDCLCSNISVMSYKLQGMVTVITKIANILTSNVTRTLLNQFLGYLRELGRDGFRFGWLITHLKNLKSQRLDSQRELLRKYKEDQWVAKAKLDELAPLLGAIDKEVEGIEEALRLAKLKQERLLIERTQAQTRLEVSINTQRSCLEDSSSLPGDFFSSPDLWFLLGQ